MMTGALTTMCWDNTPPRQSFTQKEPTPHCPPFNKYIKKKGGGGVERDTFASFCFFPLPLWPLPRPVSAYLLLQELPAFQEKKKQTTRALLAISQTKQQNQLPGFKCPAIHSRKESFSFFFPPFNYPAYRSTKALCLTFSASFLQGSEGTEGRGRGSEDLRCSGNFHLISPKGNYVKWSGDN